MKTSVKNQITLDFILFHAIMIFMIEIAFDENTALTYNGKKYPALNVPALGPSFAAYKDFALKAILQHPTTPYLIVNARQANFSFLKLAFALFVASSLHETDLKCVVFKVLDQKDAFTAYKPYIAASIAINYALRLIKLEPFYVYKELKCLNYLNFTLKENYAEKSISYTMTAPSEEMLYIETKNIFDAVVNVSLLKALSLADTPKNISLKVYQTSAPEPLLSEAIIDALINKLSTFLPLI